MYDDITTRIDYANPVPKWAVNELSKLAINLAMLVPADDAQSKEQIKCLRREMREVIFKIRLVLGIRFSAQDEIIEEEDSKCCQIMRSVLIGENNE